MEFGKKELDLTADESPGGESLAGVLDGEPAIGEKEISEAMAILEKYKSAKASLDKRIIDNEEWYKLGHWKQYPHESAAVCTACKPHRCDWHERRNEDLLREASAGPGRAAAGA